MFLPAVDFKKPFFFAISKIVEGEPFCLPDNCAC